jgi:two-component system, NtrC family, sensor kinase
MLLALACSMGFGQFTTLEKLDSFKRQLNLVKEDSTRVLMMSDLTWHYHIWNPDSGIVYGQKALALAKQIKFPRGEARALIGLAQVSSTQGDLPKCLEYGFLALRIIEQNHYLPEKAICFTSIGDDLSKLSGNPKTISYFQQAKHIFESLKDQAGMEFWENLNSFKTAEVLFWGNRSDATLAYMQTFLNATLHSDYWHAPTLIRFAEMQFQLGKYKAALDYIRPGIEIMKNDKNHYQIVYACIVMAGIFKEMKQPDSSIYYAREGLTLAQHMGFKPDIAETSLTLSEQYESLDLKAALYFRKVYDSANNAMYGEEKVQSLQKIVSEEQQLQRNKEAEKIAYRNRLKQYGLLTGLGIFLLIAFLLYRNNRQQHKANQKLQQQKEEIQNTLAQLKSTQSQLIQSEKMASLGELTAGIAHEIQNPLNFVNNFSEVNRELIQELKNEILSDNKQEAISITNTIDNNEEKINYHGKRADAIVKNMLLHSRSSTGAKEPTDINKLADEYLRLAYHGLRAKDKDFNVTMNTDFDKSIGNINIIPQDMGRLLLNLYNNAFYDVNEKQKQPAKDLSGFENLTALAAYEPTVTVSTKKSGNQVSITVSDNGNGIPQKAIDKIFQPFFTTKPTGQGTGLGLSLSYDIIKAHGGEIKVETKEGEGSEFIIQLSAV